MPSTSSPWSYSGAAADRLWHKSAIGRPEEGGSLLLSPAETLFVHHHRNVDFPSVDWLATALNADSLLMQQFAVLEALRVPGNKVIFSANLEVVGQTAQEDSWAARWASDSHPRDSSPIAEVRWFQDSDSLDSDGLFEWAERVESNGRVAEVLVVDSELSVVTYRASSANPLGELDSTGVFAALDAISGGVTSAGGRLYSTESWSIQQLGVPTEAGVYVNGITCEIIDCRKPLSEGAQILNDLLDRGLVMRPGFKYGTRWRCYDKPLGEDHAPYLVVLPSEAPHDWAGACLASRLAAGVNKIWLHPVQYGEKWCYLAVTRPPADSRWSNPNRR